MVLKQACISYKMEIMCSLHNMLIQCLMVLPYSAGNLSLPNATDAKKDEKVDVGCDCDGSHKEGRSTKNNWRRRSHLRCGKAGIKLDRSCHTDDKEIVNKAIAGVDTTSEQER